MDAMMTAVNAVVPYLIYLMLGSFFRRTNVTDEPFLKKLNSWVFLAIFPITMFANTHKLKFEFASAIKVITVGGILIALLITCSVLVINRLNMDNSRRGVIAQGMYRSNTVLFALGLAESVLGEEGAALAAVTVALFVPIYNVIAIVMLESYRGGKTDAKSLVKKILKNPLFMGAAAGVLFSLTGFVLPEVLESTISKLSGMATPLALIALGGTMKMSSIKKDMRVIAIVSELKMVIVPAIVASVCVLTGMTSVETFVVFILFATPIAVSSYPMAVNMGGDGDLAGELVAVTTIVSVVTLFGWITVLRMLAVI